MKLIILLYFLFKLEEIASDCFEEGHVSQRNITKPKPLKNNTEDELDYWNYYSNNYPQYDEEEDYEDLQYNSTINCFDSSIEEVKKYKSANRVKSVTITFSSVDTINRSIFTNFKEVTILHITSSNVSSITADAFQDLKLLTLKLDDNKISELNPNLFADQKDLELLSLSKNELKEIPKDLFKNNLKLMFLYLDHNKLKNVDVNIVPNLLHLQIGYNLFESVPDLSNNKKLNRLVLSNNSITNVQFKTLLNIEELEIAYNKLENIDDIIFLKKLKKLQLSGNIIKTIPLLNNLTFLVSLDLKSNSIEQINVHTLENLTNLESIDLSHNLLTYLPVGIFKDNKKLKKVNLSHNQITEVHYETLDMDLVVLDLSYNKLRFLRLLNTPHEVDVSHNRLTTLPRTSRYTSSKWNLNDNLFKCSELHDFQTSSLYSYVYRRYPQKIQGTTFHSPNVNGIACISNETTDDNVPEVKNDIDLETFKNFFNNGFKNTTFYKFFTNTSNTRIAPENISKPNGNNYLPSHIVQEQLKNEEVLKTLLNDLRDRPKDHSNVNNVVLTLILIVLFLILVLIVVTIFICSKSNSYFRMQNSMEL